MSNYKPLSWTNAETITLDKIKQMSDNDQALKDSQVVGLWRGDGISINKGIKILAGRVLVQASTGITSVSNVSFGNFFSQGCEPIVLLGVVSNYERRVIPSSQGWSTMRPDHRGMNITTHVLQMLSPDQNNIGKAFYVDYLVLGY